MGGEVKSIVSLLPYLRRYARALTGSQTRGDTYVRLCIETILAEPARMEHGDAKLRLFQAFHDAWRAVDSEEVTAFGAVPGATDRSRVRSGSGLAALPAVERQALLLAHLEEFTLTDIGEIIRLPIDAVSQLLDRARDDLNLVSSVSILIIEDEALIAMELARIIRELGHHVCGTASRQSEAVALAAQSRPSLILADIQLKGNDSGIDAVQEILQSVDVPVIFVTGYPERLLTGEALEPAFVIPKPFSPQMLKAAIGQALTVVGSDDADLLET